MEKYIVLMQPTFLELKIRKKRKEKKEKTSKLLLLRWFQGEVYGQAPWMVLFLFGLDFLTPQILSSN